MLQADCATITAQRFDAPAISSQHVTESIELPNSLAGEDPAVIAWRAWRDAELANEAADHDVPGNDHVISAEAALCETAATTLSGAIAQLRCALTFIGDFDGWVRNLAMDQVQPEDAAERALDQLPVRMVADVINLLEALATGSATTPCTKDAKILEGVGGWNDRVAEWKLRSALRKAAQNFGPYSREEHSYSIFHRSMIDQYGSMEAIKTHSEAGPKWLTAWNGFAAAEEALVRCYLAPADQAAAAVVEFPAPSLEAILLKVDLVEEFSLDDGSLLSKDAMEIILEDCARLGLKL